MAEKNRCINVRKVHNVYQDHELSDKRFLSGSNNKFFYIEKQNSSETYYVWQITIDYREKDHYWNADIKPIYQSYGGMILALELDYDYPREVDSYWNNRGELIQGKNIAN